MKRVISILMAALVIVSLVMMFGCSEPAPEPTPTPEPEPAPAPEPQEVIELTFATGQGALTPTAQTYQKAADMIYDRTGGRVKIAVHPGGTLVAFPDTYRGVQSGMVDMTDYVMGTNPGYDDLNRFMNLPFMGWSGPAQAHEVYESIRDKYSDIDKEFETNNVKMLWHTTLPGYNLHIISDQQVRVPEDMKGMKILAGAEFEGVMNSVGATQLYVVPPDWYTSLERGLAEAQLVHWHGVADYSTTELFKHHVILGPSGARSVTVVGLINLDTWNQLPADIQQIIEEVAAWIQQEDQAAVIRLGDEAAQYAKDLGQTFTEINQQEVKIWEEFCQPIYEEWIEKVEAKGVPGRDILETAWEMVGAH